MNETELLMTNNIIMSNPLITNIVVAIIIFIIGIILGRIAGKIVEKLLKDLKFDSTLKKKTSIKSSLEKLLSVFVQVSIYIIFTVIALNYVGVTSLILNILFIVVIFVLAISFILALKDLLPNLISGNKIRKVSEIQIGAKIKIENVEGTIKELTMTEVKIERTNGDILHIPNSL